MPKRPVRLASLLQSRNPSIAALLERAREHEARAEPAAIALTERSITATNNDNIICNTDADLDFYAVFAECPDHFLI